MWRKILFLISGEETSSSKVVSSDHNFPHFEMLEEGFSCIRMEAKSQMSEDSKNIRLTPRKTHGFDWDMVDASNVTVPTATPTTTTNGTTKSRVEEVNSYTTVNVRKLDVQFFYSLVLWQKNALDFLNAVSNP